MKHDLTLTEALLTLRAHPLRSALSMLGIAIGVAALITVLSVGAGAQGRIASQVAAYGTNLLVVRPGSGQQNTSSYFGRSGFIPLTASDAAALESQLDVVELAAPVLEARARLVFRNRNFPLTLYATEEDFFTMRGLTLTTGSSITNFKEKFTGKVVVLGHQTAQRLFGDQNPLGREIRVLNTPMRVTGVLKPNGLDATGKNLDEMAFIPFATGLIRTPGVERRIVPDMASFLLVKYRESATFSQTQNAISSLLRLRQFSFTNEAGFRIENPLERMEQEGKATSTVAWLLAIVALLSILVGGVSIMNVMLVSITQRKREIGLRMALGAKYADIFLLFLCEGLLICAIGGTAGALLGFLFSHLISLLVSWPIVVLWGNVLIAVFIAAFVGIVFAVMPAHRVAMLEPAEALSES